MNKMALDMRVPVTRITDIVHERRAITADTALRLAGYFKNSPAFWMNLQTRYDLEIAEEERRENRARRATTRNNSSRSVRPGVNPATKDLKAQLREQNDRRTGTPTEEAILQRQAVFRPCGHLTVESFHLFDEGGYRIETRVICFAEAPERATKAGALEVSGGSNMREKPKGHHKAHEQSVTQPASLPVVVLEFDPELRKCLC